MKTKALLFVGLGLLARSGLADDQPLSLKAPWQIRSSCEVKAPAAAIASAGFDTTGWHAATIPSSVVGALVTDKTYPDPFFSTNLKNLPGMGYSTKTFFANQDMPEGSPFRCSFWYRTEWPAGTERPGQRTWLRFLGINYRANIWLNGKQVADSAHVVGAFRTFEFDVTDLVATSGKNTLAVEVFAPGKRDLALTWVDWNPTPPDKDMGLWKEVLVLRTGPVALRNPFVASRIEGTGAASLTLLADLKNTSSSAIDGVLRADIESIHLRKGFSLPAHGTTTVRLDPTEFPELRLAHPRLWWPYQMGAPDLYTASFAVDVDGAPSDSVAKTFGIREVKSELTDAGSRLFTINGRKLMVLGAAWAPDMFLRASAENLDADLAYVRGMGLNTIRLEGRIDREELFQKADSAGVLVMPGWTCCDAWEHWKDWKDEQREVARESLRSQIAILRNHPSVFVWLYGSDNPPPPDVETMYLGVLKDLEWPNPSVSSASETPTSVTGQSGVKMTGPYEYVPPVYWLTDTKAGGAYGYNTETSPGPAPPTRASLERFLPKDHLWPIDEAWNYHAGLERFTNLDVFNEALSKRYGKPTSLDDFERKAQAMAYDGERAMFEAYDRNRYKATGVIQWMLNNSWPSLIWHLYDYYLVPGGGYFGTKKACELVHVQYSYDDASVAVINRTGEALTGLKVTAQIYDMAGALKGSREATVELAADSTVRVFPVPAQDLPKTYFLRLGLTDGKGTRSDNVYWLSTKPDVLDWAHKKDTVYTPQASFGDLTDLEKLALSTLEGTVATSTSDQTSTVRVTLRNKGSVPAFMVHVRVLDEKGTEVAPILWSDNYVFLAPGESTELVGRFATPLAERPGVELDGFNTPVRMLAAPARGGGS